MRKLSKQKKILTNSKETPKMKPKPKLQDFLKTKTPSEYYSCLYT